jgi:VWFA-related protein
MSASRVSHLFRFAGSSFLVAASVMALGAQAPDNGQQPSPTIRVSTRLVLVDVVVKDKNGKSIGGLKAEDFVVQEKGKTQKIALFTSPAEAKASEAPQLGPGIFSNKPEFRSFGGPLTVLLLDAANTAFKDQAYARQQMLKFVKEQYKPGQKIAIFTLTNSLGMLQDFTSDPEVLKQVLENYQPQQQELAKASPPPPSASIGSVNGGRGAEASANLVRALKNFQDVQVGFQVERRVEITLEAMRAMGRMLSGIPGRKNVIWVTAVFPFSLIPEDRTVSEAELSESLPTVGQLGLSARAAGSVASNNRNFHTEEIRQASAQLSSAQVAIYPIDARGLMTGVETLEDEKSSGGPYNYGGAADVRMSDPQSSQETMREMARETGGVAYVNQNEIKLGVSNAIEDSAASYTLGYYPDDKKWDGKYRNIKIKLNRDGELRYRRGYFAIDPSAQKDRKPDQEVAEALRDRAPDTQVTFSAQVKPPDKGKINVTFLVDPSTISVEDASGGGKKMNIVFYATIFAPDGKMLTNLSQKVDQAFEAATYEKIQKQGILVQMDLDAKPGDNNEVRLVVRDNRTGFMGTLNGTVPR